MLLLQPLGPQRIVYGFDHPWNHENGRALKNGIDCVQSWPTSSVEKDLILGGNIRGFIGRAG